jgi:four helix bundle protein
MAIIRSFRDLEVYKLAVAEARRIFFVTRRFRKDEVYSLTNQVRRSSRAVGAMISEAWARRRYEAVFVSKMDEALGEANETQCWLDHACGCEYINSDEREEIDDKWQHIGAMIRKMIDRSGDFCGTAKK